MLDVNAKVLEFITDPERRAAERKRQEVEREKRGHLLRTHPAHMNFAFGEAKESLALDLLDVPHDHKETLRLLNQLAEAYALQGRFREAAQATMDLELKSFYGVRADAVASLNMRRCNCPSAIQIKHPTDAKGQTVNQQPPIEEVFDGQRIVTFTRCSNCKSISAKVS